MTNRTRAHARHLQLWVRGDGWEDGLGQWQTKQEHTTDTYNYELDGNGWEDGLRQWQTKQEHTPDTYNYELQGKDGRMGWDNDKPNKCTRRQLQLWVTEEGWEDGLGQNQTKQEHTPDTYNYELQGKDGRMGWDKTKPNKSTRPTLTTMSYRGRMGGWAGTITNQTRAHARRLQLWVTGEGWEDGLGQNQTKQEHTPDTYNYELQGKDGRMGWDNNKPNKSTQPKTLEISNRGGAVESFWLCSKHTIVQG